MADIPGNSSTTATLTVGSTVTGQLEVLGDHDWYAITLTGGQSISVSLNGVTFEDTYLYIRDASGNLLYSNDDISDGNLSSQVAFSATYSGTYYIDVGAWNEASAGTYQVSVQAYTPPPLVTNDQIAAQLVTGYWGGDSHHFSVTQGGTITVNISTLNASEQNLARTALAEWSDIIGVTFREVTTGGQIVFDHSEGTDGPTAATDANWSGGIISSAHVQISTSWVTRYGTSLYSYSFQTYIHEIGHALGLGHAGDYNGSARYPYDALFQNDAWSTSIMSYFDQQDNTYFAGQSFSRDFAVTPMVADILAMQTLYGLSTTTRTGDTVYGYNSNAGTIYNASQFPKAAYTIFDSGGTDTLDFSGSAANQLINLNPETFSNVAGQIGNLSIARGAVIERGIGGSGNDSLIGNSANNLLDGRGGINIISYDAATAGVTIDTSITTAQNTIGAGNDTLLNYSMLIGSQFDDVLKGNVGNTQVIIYGGGGNDTLIPGSDGDTLYGDAGNDRFVDGPGNDSFNGGDGLDTVDYSNDSAGVIAIFGSSGPSDGGADGFDSMTSIEQLIGSRFDDTLSGASLMIGGAGNDTLGKVLGSAQLSGGTGNDTYIVYDVANQVIENSGEGTDTVQSSVLNYTLTPNVENLVLLGVSNGTGNGLDNVITGSSASNILSGGGGRDILSGGAGNDVFIDTKAGLNGDTIADFSPGDTIILRDAGLAGFTFSLSGNTLSYTGGSLTLTILPTSAIVASAANGGGVQLTIGNATSPAPPIEPPAHNDFNGDGRSDILWRNDNGLLTDWLGTSNGGFAPNPGNALYGVSTDWQVAGTGDFNGDGHVDVMWRNVDGRITNWLGTATGALSDNVANAYNGVSLDWHVAGVGDFNGDGRDDILWRNNDGRVTDWLSTVNGGQVPNAANFYALVDTSWHVAAIGDYNGDAIDDILWRNTDGRIFDWLATPNVSFFNNTANSLNGVDNHWHAQPTELFL